MKQEEVEQGLRFLGLVLLDNALRPDTTALIAELHEAGIRTVMVTGDHVRTGVSVAAQCGMLCQNRPVCLADAAAPDGGAEAQLSLAVMQPNGAILPAGAGEAAALLGEVASGALEAAVTGRGFQKVRGSVCVSVPPVELSQPRPQRQK